MMSLTGTNNARIDSRVAGMLLVAVFSFAAGILLSLTLVNHGTPLAGAPCVYHCPRLILMGDGTHWTDDDIGACEASTRNGLAPHHGEMLL
jgi:hypothetical protein